MINIIYQYNVRLTEVGERPTYTVIKSFDESGFFQLDLTHANLEEFEAQVVNGKLEFISVESLENFFIDWAIKEKIKNLRFFSQADFNYILLNAKTTTELTEFYDRFSKSWTMPVETKSFLESIVSRNNTEVQRYIGIAYKLESPL